MDLEALDEELPDFGDGDELEERAVDEAELLEVHEVDEAELDVFEPDVDELEDSALDSEHDSAFEEDSAPIATCFVCKHEVTEDGCGCTPAVEAYAKRAIFRN